METNNFNDPQIMQKTSGLWQKVTAILPKDVVKYGLYHKYENDFKGNYTLTVAIESANGSAPLEIDGNYYVFDVTTTLENPIVSAWQKIWNMYINRSYTFDFEQYNPDGTVKFISL
jgi:predicted transcriptional regulator YdeE